MNPGIAHVKQYLTEVKAAVKADHYTIAVNQKRRENLELFRNYVLDEAKAKDILLRLEAYDFSEAVPNEHPGREYELLYIFGKEAELLQRFGPDMERVPLYIKFNKMGDQFLYVISFHRQKTPLTYAFR